MDLIGRVYVRLTEAPIARRCARLLSGKGQTMTEYAMIVSVVAVTVYAGYKTLGTGASTLVASIDGSL
jgi:Flp pilus assembly pilin Flp